MVEQPLETLEVNPQSAPAAVVIWLHGLGADGHDFVDLVPQLGLPAERPVRFVFPHAPPRPITINSGMTMRAWYDIVHPDLEHRQDEPGIRASAQAVAELIAAETSAGLGSERLFLAGFSQGGAIALHTALRYPEPLAGVIALSTYVPLADQVASERHDANQGLSVFMAHGRDDPLIPSGYGERSQQLLVDLGYAVTWRTYPMTHAVCLAEIQDLAQWLVTRLEGLAP